MATRTKKAGATAAPTNAPETNSPEGASGTAGIAPSAGSGDGALQAPSGTQSAPPHIISTVTPVDADNRSEAQTGPVDGSLPSTGQGESTTSGTDEEPRLDFSATCRVDLDGHAYEPGEPLSLTRRQHAELKAAHAVDGDWPD